MSETKNHQINRREFLQNSTVATAALATGLAGNLHSVHAQSRSGSDKKVIVIGFDGMDPILSERLMNSGQLPNLAKLAAQGGYRRLGTSTPPQSPVAWASFINGAGPGSHGIFDFIHRDPAEQCLPFYSAARTVAGEGYWKVNDHKIQLDCWPFNHKPPATVLGRQGIPFWDYLDKAGISSVFYDLPANYPASPSKYGHHRCLSGMGVPDMLGTYGTYQHFAEDGPVRPQDEGGGRRSMIFFEGDTASPQLALIGPSNSFLQTPEPTTIPFEVHRDTQAKVAVIEIQGQILLLKQQQWSHWIKLDFELSTPKLMPNKHLSGICRFYLQEFAPNFRLYVTPINIDPSAPAMKLTEPPKFSQSIFDKLGLFYTTGFQEDHKALSNDIFTDQEYANQSETVLNERLNLLAYACDHYYDGLLFFYFSSTDMQSHMFWWDSDDQHPTRSSDEAKAYFKHLQGLYQKMDDVIGRLLERYGDTATLIAMSDHGFANFKRQFNLNTWLRDNGYLGPANSTSIMADVDWSQTRAYGLGINGLYLNLKGREKYGIVDSGAEQEQLTNELIEKLEAVRDKDNRRVIRKVHRADQVYSGQAKAYAPDLIIGYCRDFRASWDTCLGEMSPKILFDNTSAWSADHCADASEVPGVLFCNKPIQTTNPRLIDLAPTILTEFGLTVPSTMEGKTVLAT